MAHSKHLLINDAQSAVISKSGVKRCGLLRLLDQRYKGIRSRHPAQELASPTATNMLIKHLFSYGGKDHSLVFRKKKQGCTQRWVPWFL